MWEMLQVQLCSSPSSYSSSLWEPIPLLVAALSHSKAAGRLSLGVLSTKSSPERLAPLGCIHP